MKKSTSNRQQLLVKNMSRKGIFGNSTRKGAVYVSVPTEVEGKAHQIVVQVSHSVRITGSHLMRQVEQETELINITFANGSMWSGNFDKLFHALNLPPVTEEYNVMKVLDVPRSSYGEGLFKYLVSTITFRDTNNTLGEHLYNLNEFEFPADWDVPKPFVNQLKRLRDLCKQYDAAYVRFTTV